jgi:hypothetical protein
MCLTSCWLTAAAVGSWKTDPVTIRCQQTNPSRWLLPFLAALIAALAAILLGTTASTSATVRAEDRVVAFKVAGEVLVEPPQHESPGQRLGEAAAGPEFVVATGVAAEAGAGAAESGLARTLTASEQRAVSSLQRRIAEHTEKLEAYRANPDAYDNRGFLENASSPEIRQRIIDGRVNHLETEMRGWQDQIDKILGGS